jgi:hypothetical protein
MQKSKSENQLVLEAAGPTDPALQATGPAVAGSAVAGPAPVQVAENQLVPEVAGPATGPTVPEVPVQQANQSGSGSATVPTVPAPENQSGTPPVIIGRPVTELSSDSQIVQGKIIQATGPVQQANQSGPEGEGAEMVAVAVLATATKVGVKQDNPVNPEPKQNTRIKTLFLDNLHLFFGDTHLVPIKNFINPSHQLDENREMIGMNEFDREDYEHDRLIKLLKTMFFRESKGIISKVFVGGGITIDQLKNKIKKGISLIVPKY